MIDKFWQKSLFDPLLQSFKSPLFEVLTVIGNKIESEKQIWTSCFETTVLAGYLLTKKDHES